MDTKNCFFVFAYLIITYIIITNNFYLVTPWHLKILKKAGGQLNFEIQY